MLFLSSPGAGGGAGQVSGAGGSHYCSWNCDSAPPELPASPRCST